MIKFIILGLLFLSFSLLFSKEYYYSREWLNLLYYEQNGTEYKSLADDDNFFISKTGKINPQEEYEASLKLVVSQNLDFKTKFPLRYKNIVKYNNLEYIPAIQVSVNINNVIIAYPNRYMNNPASMFGHLFLVLETNQGILDSDILHYIADTAGDRSISYIMNGLSGKYQGWFLKEPYYKKIKEYNYVEDRDIIYYDLKFSNEQIENLQLHYIELQRSFFYYYFLDKNCAFFIGKLLNVILPTDIVTKRLYIIPSQIINDLVNANLLKNERVRVANTKTFNKLFNQLNNEEKKDVIKLFYEKNELMSADSNSLKAFIIISEYVMSNFSNLTETIRFNRVAAYKNLNNLNISTIRQTDIKKERVNKIQSESIGLSHLLNNYVEISYSPINFSEYNEFNNLETIGVSCLTTKIEIYPTRSPQYTLVLADLNNTIESNAVINSFSWKIKSSITYKDSFFTNQEVYIGLAWNLINSGLVFSLVGLNYTNFNDISLIYLDNINLMPAVQIGLNYHLFDNIKVYLSYQNKFQKDYLSTEVILKYNNLLNKLALISTEDRSTLKLSFEYLF